MSSISDAKGGRGEPPKRTWQLAWHDLFDADQALLASGEFDRPAIIPESISNDSRLVFGISRASLETRAMCFGLLPQGADICQRFETFMLSRDAKISADEARSLVVKLSAILKSCDIEDPLSFDKIFVFGDGKKSIPHDLDLSDSIHYFFESARWSARSESEILESAAYSFLTEPFVVSSGNWYEPGEWITGVYCTPNHDVCLALVYQLWLGKWVVVAGPDGIAIFPRS